MGVHAIIHIAEMAKRQKTAFYSINREKSTKNDKRRHKQEIDPACQLYIALSRGAKYFALKHLQFNNNLYFHLPKNTPTLISPVCRP